MSSRSEKILEALLAGEIPDVAPQSRNEAYMLALCQQGGGNGGGGSDSGGNVDQSGLSAEQISALDGMFKVCAFVKSDVSAEYEAFKSAFGIAEEVIPATDITLDKATLVFTSAVAQRLTATVEPSDTTETVVWKSSNESVAKVANGIVTPIENGTATITATVGSVSASCAVTVNVEEIVTYTITRNLTGCSSSSSVTAINEGDSHSETITSNTNYTLEGATVSVTMGGEDISDNYVDGVINVSSVTGDIVITVKAVLESSDGRNLLYNWDFTSSLVDSVQNKEAISSKDQTESGVALGYILLDGVLATNRTIELDVSEASRQGTAHGRLLMVADSNTSSLGTNGFIYRSTGYWQIYNGGWSGDTIETDANAIAGKTVKIQFDESGNATAYIGDVLVATGTKAFSFDSIQRLQVGCATYGYYDATVTALRIYEGVV